MPLSGRPWGGGCGGGSGGGSSGRLASSGALLPAALGGARSGRRPRLRRFIVSPHDPRYVAWEHSLVALVAYSAWVAPFEFGFVPDPRGALAVADNAVNAAFAVDIALTFFVAYADGGTYLLLAMALLSAYGLTGFCWATILANGVRLLALYALGLWKF